MSRWNHAVCDLCWSEREPDRTPVRFTVAPTVDCCYCGTPTTSGIFVRQDPTEVRCKGEAGTHVEDERP